MDGDPPQRPVPLPVELAGVHIDPRDAVPRWWPRVGPTAVAVITLGYLAWQALDSSLVEMAVLTVAGVAGVVVHFWLARRSPTRASLDEEGVTVSIHGGTPTTVSWNQVRGVRVFTRRVTPPLLLDDETRVVLFGLTTDQAKRLAQWLADRGRRGVVLDVDGREHQL